MYNLTLVNLAADARAVEDLAYVEQRGLTADELRARLLGFSAIDPIANATAETEIRVQVRRESYLLRCEQGKLVFYDMGRRDLPAQLLTVDEAMHELDGSAAEARHQALLLARAAGQPEPAEPEAPVAIPGAASRPRVLALAAAAVLLIGAMLYLAAPFADEAMPEGFVPMASAEGEQLQATLTGVYLTGSEPGQHGIVIAEPGALKLFELAALEAPRFVYATVTPGRMSGTVFLATDQPGGLIEVLGDGNLAYGGEIYRRIP